MSLANQIARVARRVLRAARPPVTVDRVLMQLAARVRPFSVVQVGASDAGLNDPLCRYVLDGRAVGVFIEPLRLPFEKLKEKYDKLPNVSVVQCAVHRQVGRKEIYSIDQSIQGLPDWSYQVAGFCREVVAKHVRELGLTEDAIRHELVACMDFDALFLRCGMQDVHCLLVDTEGFDFEILQLFPFARHRPKVVIFENKHLSEGDAKSSNQMLIELGYGIYPDGVDTIALRP